MDVASIKQLLVELVLAVSSLCSKVINSEIIERRSLKSGSIISVNTLQGVLGLRRSRLTLFRGYERAP